MSSSTQAFIDRTLGLVADCTFPPEGRTPWRRGDVENDSVPLTHPIRSPVSGLLVDHARTRSYVEPTAGRENGKRFVTYRLEDAYGPTPAFFSIDDLREYCRLMQRAPAPRPCYVLDPEDTSVVTLLPNLMYTEADATIRGLYAVVAADSEHEGEFGSQGCIPFVKDILSVRDETHLARVVDTVVRGNVPGACPMVVRRADINLYPDASCEWRK